MKSIIRTGKTVNDAVNQALEALNSTREKAVIEILEEPKSGLLGILGRKDAVVKVSIQEEDDMVSELLKEEFSSEKTEDNEITKNETLENENSHVEEESFKEASRGEEPKIEEKDLENNLENKEIKEELENSSDSHEIIKKLMKSIMKGMEIDSDVKITEDEDYIRVEIIDANERDTGILIGRRGETLDAIQYLISLAVNKSLDEHRRVFLDINNYRAKREESLVRLANKMASKVKKAGRSMRLEPMNPYERRIIHSALQNVDGVMTISEGKEPFRRVVIKLERN